jgi:benzoylformate decarboxylase
MVAVLGDGCAMFGIQGLWTAAQHRVPVTFVVMNNGEYRTLKDTLDSHRSESTKRRYYVGLDLGALDWTAAARFFHIESVSVRDTAQLRDIVATVGERDGPLVVDVPVRSHAREHGYGSG